METFARIALRSLAPLILLACSSPYARAGEESPARLPLVLFDDANSGSESGMGLPKWMGAGTTAGFDIDWAHTEQARGSCVRVSRQDVGRWGSLVWKESGGFNLTGASKIRFRARGESGGEQVDFKFSVFPETRLVRMTGPMLLRNVTLTNEWTSYEISLENRNLGHVKLGVALGVLSREKPVTVYLDEITIE